MGVGQVGVTCVHTFIFKIIFILYGIKYAYIDD